MKILVAHVLVRDESNPPAAVSLRADSVAGEASHEGGRLHTQARCLEPHDVRLHVGGIEGCGDHLCDGIRRHPGAPVVVGEQPDTPVESDLPCRSQYSGLPHGTAQPLAHVTRPLHRLRVADHPRARRGTKTLGEAERDGVGRAAQRATRIPEATWALNSRAPSMWTAVPLALARCETSAAAEKSGTSPPSVAWVISRTTAAERGLWSSPGRSAADNASGSISGPRVARLPDTRLPVGQGWPAGDHRFTQRRPCQGHRRKKAHAGLRITDV